MAGTPSAVASVPLLLFTASLMVIAARQGQSWYYLQALAGANSFLLPHPICLLTLDVTV
jgi:hypothetical protein